MTPADTGKRVTFAKRVLTSTVLISFTFYILVFQSIFLFSLEVMVFTALALFEFFTLLKEAQIPVFRLFGIILGLTIPAIVYLELGLTESGEVLFLVLGCLFIFLLQFFRKNNSGALIAVALTLFGILYISWFLSFVIKIRFLDGGSMWVVYLVTVTKAADIGAYGVGTLIGRHSLIPHISPKKSIEGTVGGLVASVFASLIFGPYLPLHFHPAHLAILGCLIGMVGQIGDLSESLIKRFCQVKDSGLALPGMGGIMDAIDSILFTAPIFYFHLKLYI